MKNSKRKPRALDLVAHFFPQSEFVRTDFLRSELTRPTIARLSVNSSFLIGLKKKMPVRGLIFTLFVACGLSACTSSDSTNPNESDNGADSVLGNLPNPPLSEAPSSDDEPVAESSNLNTVTNFQVVRDTGDPIPTKTSVEYTDADFEAGLLPAQISVPVDVDPSQNSAPDFANLMNIEAVAGELVEIVFDPIDAEGVKPGMFPVELAQGASFDDNFDGSKTYRWQPLESDVGIASFSVTAIDPATAMNPSSEQYQTTRTVLIRVSLPDDLTSIPNVPPSIEPFITHTARQNDPVVLELKGFDLNGTIPSLELISDLPQASFVEHPRQEGVYTLRFIPTTLGENVIEIRAIDELDSNLSAIETLSVNVLAPSAFERSGQRLRDLAAARGILFGYASLQEFYHRPDGAIYADTAASEFNIVSPENAMKMDVTNPTPGRYQFADIDNLISFAKQNDLIVHGHPVIWYRQLPEWILNVSADDLEGHMREYIHRLMYRYHDDISIWDVVNEPIGDNGGYRESIWYQAMGEQYLDTAFHQAKVAAPDGVLLLNDFDIAFNGPKSDTLFTMLEGLLEREVPIDGVGFQMHLFDSFDKFDEVRTNFARVAELGLDIYITELDVSLSDSNNLQIQANVYQSIVELCLEQPRCKAIQTWGFTDQYSFREIFEPLMFDKAYQPKPAYTAIQQALTM